MRNHKWLGQVNKETNIGKIISKAQNVEKLDEKILQSVLAELTNEFRKGKPSKVHFNFFSEENGRPYHRQFALQRLAQLLNVHFKNPLRQLIKPKLNSFAFICRSILDEF